MKTHDKKNDPKSVYFLVRVFDIKTPTPKAAFFPNPWKLMGTGEVHLGELEVRDGWDRYPVDIKPRFWTAAEL